MLAVVRLGRELSEALGRKVDLLTEAAISPYLRERIATNLLQDGATRQIEIIGEATKPLSKDLRRTYPEIPWQDIAGMRDTLIHD